ncbi:hypothetical protein PPSIR1_25266 [Plesiocystis pacifica SIR-1]|uniref:Uncharacterized protein n=1 Tax=Plesiocystis pacifica SIR-1 TaxID=391625 RepID=A6FZ67_9BACT|nr:baseplate J/gp47 family protein [Plesiocystis pacifica]EDM80951.1 hypothetical protein PPSIR1_25266 [Plesiocystis pacifica SIR-1]
MARRKIALNAARRDGSSQASRRLQALAPGYAQVDERGSEELLAFARAYAEQLRYYDLDDAPVGDWRGLFDHDELEVADFVAYVQDPEAFSGPKARWLARPHLVLFLTFVELLGWAREQLNQLTERHLDYYFEEVLGQVRRAPEADRVAVLVELASGVSELRIPAGTEFQAGLDSSGKPRIYKSERDLFANRASIAELRSVFVDFERTTLHSVSADRDLSEAERFDAMLQLSLGEPKPGDPVAKFQNAAVNVSYCAARRSLLLFPKTRLGLEFHELRTLMRLRERRGPAADSEWEQINELMQVDTPNPRDFDDNLEAVVGELNYDGLPQVETIDELYYLRDRPDVAAFIDDKLFFGREAFEEMMRIKLRIDGEWDEINRLLERGGRRLRKVLNFSLEAQVEAKSGEGSFDPTDFDTNLATAVLKWQPPWPDKTTDLDSYYARLTAFEEHMAMAAEHLLTVCNIARRAKQQTTTEQDWPRLVRFFDEAHRDQLINKRRDAIEAAREDMAEMDGLLASGRFVLDIAEEDTAWPALLARFGSLVDPSQVEALDRFHGQLADPDVPQLLTWDDVDRILELAWRQRTGLVIGSVELLSWRNLYAHEDATELLVDSGLDVPRWLTFGQRAPDATEDVVPEPLLGTALRSPLLALRSGQRRVVVTMGFETEGFDEARIEAALAEDALRMQVSTEKAWVDVEIVDAKVVGGAPNDDYYSLAGVLREPDEDRPALQLTIEVDETVDPFAPLKTDVEAKGERWPTLRMMLRQLWDSDTLSYRAAYEAFSGAHLNALHLRVSVEELDGLRLRTDERKVDAKKPFEPFGRDPVPGARLYFSHPELVLGRLEQLRMSIEWMGLPDNLLTHYTNYPAITGYGDFKASFGLVNQALEVSFQQIQLFAKTVDQTPVGTDSLRRITIGDLPGKLATANSAFDYYARTDVPERGDLRYDPRYFYLELDGDFGHRDYSTLAARKGREMAAAIAKGVDLTGEGATAKYEVPAPYTPKIKRIRAGYTAALELRYDGGAELGVTGDDQLIHVHPFGQCPAPEVEVTELGDRGPRALPDYSNAGELYIGLADLSPSQRLSLLVQVAEGSADPDVEGAPVRWSVLDGDEWVSLHDGRLRLDATRGLINSGLLEFDLDPVEPSEQLPKTAYWLRASIARDPDAACDTLAIHTQALEAVFDDRGNAADHYETPLAAESLDRLIRPNSSVAKVIQPYTSFGGRPTEEASNFRVRVSERLRHKQRALTPWDYEQLVLERFATVYKAKCLRASAGASGQGGAGKVRVVVVPDIRAQLPRDPFEPKAPSSHLAEIQEYLRAHAPDHVEVSVTNPEYVAVMVRLGVRFNEGIDEGWASRQLNEDIKRLLSPWAYDDGAELSIGGRIYANSIIDYVDRRDYVDYVAELKLFTSLDGIDFSMAPDLFSSSGEGYYVGGERDDQILVAARDHQIDIITERYQQEAFTGLEYMKVELDFIVG